MCRENSPDTEVEHYIPFNINPAGMQPILATSYLFAFPTIVARLSFCYRLCLVIQISSLWWTICNVYGLNLFKFVFGRIFGSRFWEHVSDVLNPETSRGAGPWVYYTLYAFFVFLFNIFDIVSSLIIYRFESYKKISFCITLSIFA